MICGKDTDDFGKALVINNMVNQQAEKHKSFKQHIYNLFSESDKFCYSKKHDS